MLAADGIEGALAGEGNMLLAAGGNGVALGMLGGLGGAEGRRAAGRTPTRTSR